jgi:hypothetical protein
LAAPLGVNAAARFEKFRLALLGAMGTAPRTRPADRTCSPDTRLMLPNCPPRKASADIPDTPLKRAFL